MSSPFWHQRRKVSEYVAFDYPRAMDSRPTATIGSCESRHLVPRSPSTATAAANAANAVTAALTPPTERRCREPNPPLSLPPRSSAIPLFHPLDNLPSSQSLASYLYSDTLSSTSPSPPPCYTRAISTTGVSQMAPVRFISGRTTNRKQKCKTPVYQIPINLIQVSKLPTYAEISPAHFLPATAEAEAEAAAMIKDVLTLPGCRSSGPQGRQANEQEGGGGLSCSYAFSDLMNHVHDLLAKHQNNSRSSSSRSSSSRSSSSSSSSSNNGVTTSSSPKSRTSQHPSSDRETSPSPPPPPPSSPTLASPHPLACPSPKLGKHVEEAHENNNNKKKNQTAYSCDIRLYFNTGSDLFEYRLGPKSGAQTLRGVLEMARARGVGSNNNSSSNSNSSGGSGDVGRDSIGGGRHESWGRRWCVCGCGRAAARQVWVEVYWRVV